MGVPLRRAVVPVAEHLADDLEGDAVHDGVAGDRVAEVMEAYVGDAGEATDDAPGVAEAVELVALARADDEALAGIALRLREPAEQIHHLVGDDDVALAGLGVGETEHRAAPVDVLPAEVADLVAAHPRENEEANGGDPVRTDVTLLAERDLCGGDQDPLQGLAPVAEVERVERAVAEIERVAPRTGAIELGFGLKRAIALSPELVAVVFVSAPSASAIFSHSGLPTPPEKIRCPHKRTP